MSQQDRSTSRTSTSNSSAPRSSGGRSDGNQRRRARPASQHAAATETNSPTTDLDVTVYAAPTEPVTFEALGVRPELVAVLAKSGITTAFPIQAATLPDSLNGRDVLGRGKTGSGKTVAFALPTVSALAGSGKRRQPNAPRALVLVPTRELANQVAEVVAPLAAALGLRTATVFGGVSQGTQVRALQGGLDILIACPGRLEDLIGQGHCRLDAIEVTVLDEADHMADLGFLPGVKRLLDRTPTRTQRLLFSATLDRGVDVLVKRYLDSPVTHSVDSAQSAVSTMEHHVFSVTPSNKSDVVRELVSGQGRTVAFTRTKHQAKKLAKALTASGIPSVDLHGNLSQNARERNLAAFSGGEVRVLVATDIAARGIHVDDITLVVHIDPPAEHKSYLHRSGRTARAGADGVVVTVATPDQAGDVRTLMRQAGISPTIRQVSPGHAAIVELSGPAAPHVEPVPVVEPAPQRGGQGKPRNRSNTRSQGSSRSAGGQQSSGGQQRGRSAGSSGSASPKGRSGGSAGGQSRGTSGPTSAVAFSTSSGSGRGR